MQLSLDAKRVDLSFLICLLFTLFTPIVAPTLRLNFFAPFLIICLYRFTLPKCLAMALLSGLILDILATDTRIGLNALGFCLTLAILYPQKRNFFADSLSTLPLMTFFFGVISSFIMATLMYSIEMQSIISLPWIFIDGLLMPFFDACYALLIFIVPGILFGKPIRRGQDYFE
jgi:rod shape-determining protein MreD